MAIDYAGYEVGSAWALVRGGAVVLLATPPDEELCKRLWDACAPGVRATTLLRVLLRRGLAHAGDLALAVPEPGGTTAVLLRGDVAAHVVIDGVATDRTGVDDEAWVELVADVGAVVTLAVGASADPGRAGGSLLPLAGGIVAADRLRLAPVGSVAATDAADDEPPVEAGHPRPVVTPVEHPPAAAAAPAPAPALEPDPEVDVEPSRDTLAGHLFPEDSVADRTLIGADLGGGTPHAPVVERAPSPPGTGYGALHIAPPAPPRATAQLRLPSGDVVPLDRPALVGRTPHHAGPPTALPPRLVVVPSPSGDISRTHVRIELLDGHPMVTDLNSTNGVMVLAHYLPPVRLHPGAPTPVDVGSRIDLGDGVVLLLEPAT